MGRFSVHLIFFTLFFSLFSVSAKSVLDKTLEDNSVFNACPAPTISSFFPSNGPTNTLVFISGSDFTDVTSVQFDGVLANYTVINDNEIEVFVPDGLSGNSTISMITSGGCSTFSTNDFTVFSSFCVSGEIYISEVYDSQSGSFGVIELYNPTTTAIDLQTVYEIERYGDIGDATPSVTIPLAGTIDPMDTFIIELGSTGNVCTGLSPNITLAAGINANDELRLLKNSTVIDVIYTNDETGYTFIREADAVAPSPTFVLSEWNLMVPEDCSDLRAHTANPGTSETPDITQPLSQTVCENDSAIFTVSVISGTYNYQWFYLNSIDTWEILNNDSNYSGTNTSTLTITNIPSGFNREQYYCQITSSSCDLVSDAVLLTVLSPLVDIISDQTVCTDYTLPNLTDGDYFTQTNGGGVPLNAGDIISTTQTIFIYNEIGTPPNNCSNESSFTVTVNGTPNVDVLSDQTVCTDYTLPNLTDGSYFTQTNGGGVPLNAGDIISTTQTIFIYNEIGTPPNNCSNESSFTVTVNGTPNVDMLSDQTVCTDYTLPNLTDGDYFTQTNGGGVPLNAGDIISTTQTIFIYNEIGTPPNNCSNESSFTVTVNGTPNVDVLSDQTVCTDYTLPNLTDGDYFTQTNGGGVPLNAGDIISTTQTIFIYNEIGTPPNNCSNESSFTVTVNGTPNVDVLSDQTVCTDYTLPNLTDGDYFTQTNGGGVPLNAGDIISTTQTIFIYNEIGTPPNNCSNESSFTVTVNGTPNVDVLSDQTVCTDYTLPNLTDGDYFTQTNGGGVPLNAGDIISTTQTIFIYNEIGTPPNNCSNESSFTVTVNGTPNVDVLSDQTVCTDYTLPNLTDGDYFTQTNGGGVPLNAGDIISTTQTIFIYNEIGTPPNNCSNESSFTITIGTSTDFELSTDNLIIVNDMLTVQMTDTSIFYEYAVDFSGFQTSPIFSNLSDGEHTLYVREIDGCFVKSVMFNTDRGLFIPKFLTPNGDGFKDFWKIKDPNNIVSSIFIFDRFGKLLKQLSPNSIGWDGNYNGNALESTDYWYVIELKNSEQLKGHFTLKR